MKIVLSAPCCSSWWCLLLIGRHRHRSSYAVHRRFYDCLWNLNIAGLVLIILGFDVMESPLVVIVSTIIPLAMSLGLVWERLISLRTIYLAFAIIGFLAVLITRSIPVSGKVPTVVLAIVHGVAGLTIVLLPVIFTIRGAARPAFLLVGVGGALIGIGGLLLLKAAADPLGRRSRILPGLLLMTACFVADRVWIRETQMFQQ